jgi:hypothetical protein
MATSKAVAVKQNHEVAAFSDEVPEYLRGQTGNRGSEDVGSKDVALPRLEIVQSQSPIKETNEDAREGMFFNSATGDLLGDTVYFVPVYYRTEYLIWKDKDSGGGFFGAYPTEDEARVKRLEVIEGGEDEDLIEIVDTPIHYGLMVFPDGRTPQQIVISMAKSKAKVSRKWNAAIQIAGGDRFSRVYKLTTFTDKNKQGKTFKNFVVQPAGFPPESVYRLAEQNYAIFKQGAKVDHGSAFENEAAGENGDTARGDV